MKGFQKSVSYRLTKRLETMEKVINRGASLLKNEIQE